MAAKTIIDVILGEAASGSREQRYDDMLHIASVISNRSALTGRDPVEVVSASRAGNKKEFDAYGKPLPSGVNSYRSLAEQAWQDVQTNGPVTQATFYATPKAASRLPSGLQQAAQTTGHIYYTDPKNRALGVGSGFASVNASNALPVRGEGGLSAYAGIPVPAEKPSVQAVNNLASSTALSSFRAPIPEPRPTGLLGAAQQTLQGIGQGVGRVLESPRQIAVSAMNPLLSALGGVSRMASPAAAGNMEALLNTEFRTAENYYRTMTGNDFPPIDDAIAKSGTSRERNTPNSQHFQGKAVDISTKGMSNNDKLALFESLQRSGFTSFGFGPTILHADIRPNAATWTYSNIQKWGGVDVSTLSNAVYAGTLPEDLKQQAWKNAPIPEARPSIESNAIVPPNPDGPSLDAYQSGYGNERLAAPIDPVTKGDPLAPAAFGGDPVLANAGGFVSPLGDLVSNPSGMPDPNTMPAENMPFVPLGDPSKGNVTTGVVENTGMQLAPLDSAYPVTPGNSDPLASLTPEQMQRAAETFRAEQGLDLGPQNGRPNNAPSPSVTPPSNSMAGVTSDDLADALPADPLRAAMTQMAADSTNVPVPTPRPSIEPVPQERPALYANSAPIPVPADRPQTQTSGIPVSAPTTDPWDSLRVGAADPLSSLVAPYADTGQPSGFAKNLAYAQAQGPSQIDIDPALMDPALGAPVDPLAPAIQAPVQPLAPLVSVPTFSVKEAAPEAHQTQKMTVPSGMDVWQGASNYGVATDNSTLSRNPDGTVSRYSDQYDRWDTYNPQTDMWTPGGGNDPLAGALGGFGLSKSGGLSSEGKQKGQASGLKNAMKGAMVGGKVGGIPGAVAGALVGANAQGIANGGGPLGTLVGGMFGISPLGGFPAAPAPYGGGDNGWGDLSRAEKVDRAMSNGASRSTAEAIADGAGGLF